MKKPNWYKNTNVYWTEEEHEDEINKLYEFIKSEFTKCENSDKYKLLWLETLLEKSGLNSNRYECMGYITYFGLIMEKNPKILYFKVYTHTASKPMPDVMKALIKQYPHMNLSYCSEDSRFAEFRNLG